MQEQGKRVFRLVTKMNTFHVKNMTKNINPGKIIFVYSYNSERKQLNLKLLNFFCTYMYARILAFKNTANNKI